MGDSDPIRPDEVHTLFQTVIGQPVPACALAVSGGSDSAALMVLFADWLRGGDGSPAAHVVLTVDHGLRPEAAEEAQSVAKQAAALGFRQAVLRWNGPKPDSGIQAAARAARYGLIGDYMRANGIPLLLTGHTQDDQAETVLMRLARGSGLDGLTGIAPRLDWPDLGLAAGGAEGGDEGMRVARPLLPVSRARLRATLTARGIPWIEDPSNSSADFERPRLRAAREHLETLGLTADKLALTAERLQRVRTSVERSVDDFCRPESGAVVVDPLGFISLNRERLCAVEAEIALRALGRAIAACGGSPMPVPLGKLEGVAELVRSQQQGRWTLARAMVTATGSVVTIEREPGRQKTPVLHVRAGERVRWDGRFEIEIDKAGPLQPVEVRACGEDAARRLLKQQAPAAAASLHVASWLPSFWISEQLAAVPLLDYWSAPHCRDLLRSWFIGGDIVRGRRAGPGTA